MTKKQILFWRILLILIVVLLGYFVFQKVTTKDTITDVKVEVEKSKPQNKEIKFNIRKPDFYKGE